MRAVVQRVRRASVSVDGEIRSSIGKGILVLLGIGRKDTAKDAAVIAEKCVHLRIFEDEAGVMNRSVLDVGGEILLVSQFTLMGDARRGRRPSYIDAMAPDAARAVFRDAAARFEQLCPGVQTGVFQADMDVELVNHGPVTILLDSTKAF